MSINWVGYLTRYKYVWKTEINIGLIGIITEDNWQALDLQTKIVAGHVQWKTNQPT